MTVTTSEAARAWASVPSGRFVGNTSVIPHSQVQFIASLIDSSGVAQQIDEWRRADNPPKRGGGRPSIVSTRTALTLLFLLSSENSALFIGETSIAAHQRLSDESMTYLGLAEQIGRDASAWYFPVYRALERALEVIDPQPGQRRKFPTLEEIELIKESWKDEKLRKKHDRLQWVCNQLLESTLRLVPAEVQRKWKGDLSVDATVVAAYGRKGAPVKGGRGAVEYSAGHYVRTSSHKLPTGNQVVSKHVFGWDLTIAVQTAHDPNKVAEHPLLVAAIGMSIPGADLVQTAARMFASVVERGHPVGRATGDRGYAAGAVPIDYQIPLRLLGYQIVTDYKDDQVGKKESYAGAIQVEGAYYCPSMPEDLVNATVDLRAGKITGTAWRKLIVARRPYMLRAKEKPDAKGRVPMVCPARGNNPTVNCPLVDNGCGSSDKQTTIYDPPKEEDRDLICTNRSSVQFPIDVKAAKYLQHMQYGSQEWIDAYRTDRNVIEGQNAFLKDGAHEALGDAGRRRLRGSTAQLLLITMLVASGNLRKIQTFRDSAATGSANELERRREHIQRARDLRKANEERIAPWDDLRHKKRAEKAAAAKATADRKKEAAKAIDDQKRAAAQMVAMVEAAVQRALAAKQ